MLDFVDVGVLLVHANQQLGQGRAQVRVDDRLFLLKMRCGQGADFEEPAAHFGQAVGGELEQSSQQRVEMDLDAAVVRAQRIRRRRQAHLIRVSRLPWDPPGWPGAPGHRWLPALPPTTAAR